MSSKTKLTIMNRDLDPILERLQHQRDRFCTMANFKTYSDLVKAVSDLSTRYFFANEIGDTDGFEKVCDLIAEYGAQRERHGFWDGAICYDIELIWKYLEKAEAAEYEADQAAAAQLDMLDPDKPDHPHDARCDGHGTG